MTPEQALEEVLRLLRNSAPDEYDAFLSIYGVHVSEVTDAVITSDTANILIAQGHAQHAKALARIFAAAVQQPSPPKSTPTP